MLPDTENFGCSIGSVEEKETGFDCILTDSRHYEADLIVLCIGTRANTGVVDPQEVQVDRGILVNEEMETSCPGIYAAGDCSQGREMQTGKQIIIGLWANAGHQGATVGHNMAGGSGNYDGNILHNITHFMGMNLRMFAGDERTKKALEKLDFFVDVDLFITDTAGYADIVLPAFTSMERGEFKCYPGGYAWYTKPVVEPLGEAKSDAEILTLLARKMDLPDDLLK